MRGGAIPLPLHPQRQFDRLWLGTWGIHVKFGPRVSAILTVLYAAHTVGLLGCGAVVAKAMTAKVKRYSFRDVSVTSSLPPIAAKVSRCNNRRDVPISELGARPTAPDQARWNELPRAPFLPRPEPNLDLCRPTVRTNRPYPLIVHRHKGAPHNGRAVN